MPARSPSAIPDEPAGSRLGERLRDKLANHDNGSSWSARFRLRRWNKLLEFFPNLGQMQVLDLGGTTHYWKVAPVRPAHVTVVNLAREPDFDGISAIQADVTELKPIPCDLVISNSLLEHVGGAIPRHRMADLVRASSDRYWVQTPYRYFPVEPHWLFPGFQFLPLPARAWVTQNWALSRNAIPASDHASAVEAALGVELLSATEMRSLFPDALIWYERVGGLPKSITAVGGLAAPAHGSGG